MNRTESASIALCLLLIRAPALAVEPAVEKLAESCMACHGPGGVSTHPKRPSLAGRSARELYLGLQQYKQGRPGSRSMTEIAGRLSSHEMQALADYFAARKPAAAR